MSHGRRTLPWDVEITSPRMMMMMLMCFVVPRFPPERGLWRALPLCQHVDGQNLLPGRICHHGYLCKAFRPSSRVRGGLSRSILVLGHGGLV